jgi:hypothetical protein
MEQSKENTKLYLELAIHNDTKSVFAIQDRVWSTQTKTMNYILYNLVWNEEEMVGEQEFKADYTVRILWNSKLIKTA